VGIPPAPRGVPQIEVTFDIDANGIVNVSAKDLGTGQEQKITITSSSGLSDEEIKRMVRDAETHSDEDKRKREVIETRNKLDTLIYSVDKTLAEQGSQLPEEEKSAIEAAIKEAKEAQPSEDPAVLNEAMQKLTQASHKLAEKIYQNVNQQQQQQGGGPGPDPGAGAGESGPKAEAGGEKRHKDDDDVIDAEVVD
jgi:molecular chaperone DnaK